MDGLARDDAGSMDDDKQRDPRDSLFLGARLRLPGDAADRAVRVRNLSEQGAMVELDRDVPVGTRLELELRNIGTVTGEVVWTVADRAGILLDRAIDPQRARFPVGSTPRR